MRMFEFEWFEPQSISEVTQMLSQYQESVKLIAGGTWVTLVLKQRLLFPSALISLRKVPGLDQIEYKPGQGLFIGAMVTHREEERSPLVRRHFPVLAETFATVANIRVRNQATVAGVLCDADYASDPPATLAALKASVSAVSQRGERSIPVRDLIVGHYSTVLMPDELVTRIFVPEAPVPLAAVYLKYRTRSHEDRPCLGVAAVLQMAPDGGCKDIQVVIGAVSHTPQVVEPALASARGQKLTLELIDHIAERYSQDIDPISDLRASAWYRKQMVQVFTRRAILAALSQAAPGGDAL
jgi:carbon-monoxide dehydrogenase medium subunit